MPHYYIYDESSGEIVQTGFGAQDFIDGFNTQGKAIAVGHADLNEQIVQDGKLVMKPDNLLSEMAQANAMAEVRHIRELLLARSDWTQLPDAPVDQQAWATYRQALRDLPSKITDPREVVWPEPPNS